MAADLDFMVMPRDAEPALAALVDAGMREERPPEQWLLKAWDGDILIDLIYDPAGLPMSEEVMGRGERLSVAGMWITVMALEDLLTTMLMALGEHALDYEQLLQISRTLREQIDWSDVRARTHGSPYARPFFTLLEELEILPRSEAPDVARPRVRVA
jgi:hypothetical protein